MSGIKASSDFQLFTDKWLTIKEQLNEKLNIDTASIPTVHLGSDILVEKLVRHLDKNVLIIDAFNKTIEMSDCTDADTLYLCCQRMADLCQTLNYGPAGVWLGIFCEEILEKYYDAQYWYNRAAHLGNGLGMYHVGLLYLNKKVPLPQQTNHKRCFTDALDHGVMEAQRILDTYF